MIAVYWANRRDCIGMRPPFCGRCPCSCSRCFSSCRPRRATQPITVELDAVNLWPHPFTHNNSTWRLCSPIRSLESAFASSRRTINSPRTNKRAINPILPRQSPLTPLRAAPSLPITSQTTHAHTANRQRATSLCSAPTPLPFDYLRRPARNTSAVVDLLERFDVAVHHCTLS